MIQEIVDACVQKELKPARKVNIAWTECAQVLTLILYYYGVTLILISSIEVMHNQLYPLLHLFLEVHGSWGNWEEWSTCQECKRGVMKRTRDCNVKGNGRQCVGKAEEFKSGMNGVFDNYIKTMNG